MAKNFTTFALLLCSATAVLSAALEERDCNANNCLRGVRGTASVLTPDWTSRMADCSSFMRATVTPAPTTTTVTISVATTLTVNAKRAVEARQITVSPSTIPAYATFCSGSSAYSSGCSCAGVTKTTTTAPTPTITVTTTATATATVRACPVGQALCNGACANLISDNNNCGACGTVCTLPFVCGQGACVLPKIYSCSGEYGTCGGACGGTCFSDVNGVDTYCKVARPCDGLQPCGTDADCPSQICLANACGNVCAQTQYLCPNNLAPKRIFRKTAAAVTAAGTEAEKVVEKRGPDFVLTEVGPVPA